MTIAGIDGSFPIKILSKDPTGPGTRLVKLPAGWGTSANGAFTAQVEIFVIRGELLVSGISVRAHEYTSLQQGKLLAGFRARSDVLGLVITSAPVRYDTAAGGLVSRPTVYGYRDKPWTNIEEGRFTRPITDEGHLPVVWLSGFKKWKAGGGWQRHLEDHEWFVLDGEISFEEFIDGEPKLVSYGPGGYAYRPEGVPHAGPSSSAPDAAVVLCRSRVPLEPLADRSSTSDDQLLST